jgi:hypothetical protein
MNNIELNKVAIQSIGIDTIRLPGVGSASAKGSGSLFHKSLVDAWFMSGYSNDNPPDSISGYKGHELVLKNFAFTPNSGFGGSGQHSGGTDGKKAASSYEGSLVFDGVDDYAVCDNIPILTDYTVICRRQIWDKQDDADWVLASKSMSYGNGAFIFEFRDNKRDVIRSYGDTTFVSMKRSDSVSYQTATSYNGTDVLKGAGIDSSVLHLGNVRPNDTRYLHGAIYYFALYDKSLTPDEIEQEKIKLNEIWTKRLNG